MHCSRTALLLVPLLLACAGSPRHGTLADLRDVEADMSEVQVRDGLDQAMDGYRRFLEEAPESELTPEAMRRLADLKVEKEYGLLGEAAIELPAPDRGAATAEVASETQEHPRATGIADHSESSEAFERRVIAGAPVAPSGERAELVLPEGEGEAAPAGPLEAIEIYDRILAAYPNYVHSDQVLYQKARAYDELGRVDEAVAVIERLVAEHPRSTRIDEVQFRRAEYFFTRKRYLEAEEAYSAITAMGPSSQFYELALYKLGWTFYKQELHEEALNEYVKLLDFKVSTGYDFDQSADEADQRRIADTYRVISLSFSNVGGPDSVEEYFATRGRRGYEDRIYSHLGEFYLDKLRYHDAAASYRAFVDRHPLHPSSPHFGMRVVEIYEAGGFPKLVLESKREFAEIYGLDSEYWRHFDVADSPDVLRYLRVNLEDLASHYHTLYQDEELVDERPASFQEALHWYRAYLVSFPGEPETPSLHHRLADLLLEHEDFGEAAREYERVAYDYPEHEPAAAAGYAAIYAHREGQKAAIGAMQDAARRAAVDSSLRFVDRFPGHEHAAAVMGAAVEDLYAMAELDRAIATGRDLIARYPEADLGIRRSAWTAVAHASFDSERYPDAEDAYARVLELTPEEDDSRQAVAENLAAAIYKQGERASLAEDHRTAADHFLKIAQAAPTSEIRPLAEYDAAAALIRLEDWAGAAEVLEAFRRSWPDHELHRESTRQIAFVYREAGNLSRAAAEYERVAKEAEEPELRREALLVAGDLYEQSNEMDRALAVYLVYVEAFPEPLESAVETRFRIAEMFGATGDQAAYHDQLARIVEIDRAAGDERTERVRYLAARSALVLAEVRYRDFEEIRLTQPFEENLQEKQRRMDTALAALGGLVDYEVGPVTAAATFYMAEVYLDFSRALLESERPVGLVPEEAQAYELALEEEAFPFEESAIEVHEKNLELLTAGIYNGWVERSLERLAELVPGRYAKAEASSGWIDSIDTYAYVPPGAPVASPSAPVPAAQAEDESWERIEDHDWDTEPAEASDASPR